MKQPILSFIGAGNMSRAIIEGLLAEGYDPKSIRASRRTVEALSDLKARGVETSSDNRALTQDSDAVVLGVKPQMMRELLGDLREDLLRTKPLVISLAAGISVNALERWLDPSVPIVRAMPNTPSLIGRGAAGLLANSIVSEDHKTLAESLFSSVGVSIWVDTDDDIDRVTAISGSGPAYFFLMIEKMVESGVKLGLDEATSRKLALQTALGASEMASRTDKSPAELRRQVTSPGGTTEQAILSFERDGFGQSIENAMQACRDKATTLTEILGKES